MMTFVFHSFILGISWPFDSIWEFSESRLGRIIFCAGNLEGARLSDGVTSIVAIDFGWFPILTIFLSLAKISNMRLSYTCAGLKDALFNLYLIQDATYLLFGLLVIFLSVSRSCWCWQLVEA